MPLHRAALDARERLLTDAKRPDALAAALQSEHAASEDEFERVQAALRAALVMKEQAGVHALSAFRPVFTARPDHVGALVAVEDAYRLVDDPSGLAATYERLAAAVRDPRAQLAVLGELATVRAAEGGDAAAIHRRILALAPDDPRAIEELCADAERRRDVDTQLAMHAKLAAAARDASVGVYHHQKIGELLLEKGDAAGALAAFQRALALDPQSLGATDGLTRAARAARDPAALQHAARFEALVTRDRGAALALLLEAARIWFAADREDEAAAAYEEALSLVPDDPEAAAGVMATMMSGGKVPRLVEVLSRAAHAATDPGRAAVLHLSVALLCADLLMDLPSAIAATKRAIAARPKHEVAIASLAAYLERNGQWVEAVETLERMIAKAQGPELLRLHLRVARIAEKHLRDPARAKASLRIVLEADENHAEALTAMVRLERLTGNDEEALRLARKLITVVVDPVHRGAAFAELAELEKARGRIEDAANAAYWALEIQGPQGPAAALYRELIASAPQHASWDTYVAGLLRHIERGKAYGGDIPAGYRELARVFDRTQRPDVALPALREGVIACPDEASISLALVAALRQAGAETEALAELRRLTSVDVCEAGAWRILADVLARMGVADGAACALAPLVVLGQASAEEEQVVRARRPRPASAPAMILAGSGLKQLIEGTALDEPPAIFIPAVIEIVTKLEGIEYERWGVNKRDRIRAGDAHPIRSLADRIGRMFGGVPEYDIFLGVSSIARPFVVAGSPPALLLPAGFERLSEAVQSFHLARPLALLSRSLHPLDHVDDAAMEKLLVGVVRQFVPRFRLDPVYDEEELDLATRRVAKAIGFFSRSRIQEAASAFAQAPPRHYPEWAREIRRLAARAALLVADDLLATLEALGEPLGGDNYASDLARFWVSDPAIRFRRAVAQQP
ncbi:MAG TPA: tetratricopeptide repeat protein [Sandaracinaceae bacterium]